MAYKIHKFCALFPDMSKEQYAELKNDIAESGLQVPIWTWGNYIIDGKNRQSACEDVEAEPFYRKWEPKAKDAAAQEKECLLFVVSLNLSRRHLSSSQLAMLAVDISNFKHGGNNKKQDANLHLAQEVTRDEAAKQLGISERSVDAAATVKRDAVPEVTEAVKQGDITVNDASKIKDLPAKEQKAAVKAVQNGHARTAAQAIENAKPDKPATNGKPFDDNGLQSNLGKLIRAFDARASATNTKKSESHKKCRDGFDMVAEGFKELRKETAK